MLRISHKHVACRIMLAFLTHMPHSRHVFDRLVGTNIEMLSPLVIIITILSVGLTSRCAVDQVVCHLCVTNTIFGRL